MVEQVEEVCPESQVLPFPQLERFVQRKIYVFLRRPNNTVSRRVAVHRRIAWHSVGKSRRQRIGRIGRRIDPIAYPRFGTPLAGSVAAAVAPSKRGGRRGRAGKGVRRASRRIINRERRSGLQDYYAACLPSRQASPWLNRWRGRRRAVDRRRWLRSAAAGRSRRARARLSRHSDRLTPRKERHRSGGNIVN